MGVTARTCELKVYTKPSPPLFCWFGMNKGSQEKSLPTGQIPICLPWAPSSGSSTEVCGVAPSVVACRGSEPGPLCRVKQLARCRRLPGVRRCPCGAKLGCLFLARSLHWPGGLFPISGIQVRGAKLLFRVANARHNRVCVCGNCFSLLAFLGLVHRLSQLGSVKSRD